MEKNSYLIVGGGIIGSSVAREIGLRKYGPVVVLEKETSLGMHQSGRNSGVLHSGINQKPGSIKGEFCVRGNKEAREHCREHGVQMEECGTWVIARNQEEESVLETLLVWGNALGVEGLRIVSEGELVEREPSVAGRKALYSPRGAIVDSVGFLEAIASEAKQLGAEYRMGAEVLDIQGDTVITTQGDFKADHIINCAGLYADKIAHAMGVGKDYVIIPFRGDYTELLNLRVNSMAYQPPNLKYPFLGVHFTRTVDGRVLAGPTATLAFGRESYQKEFKLEETLEMLKTPNFRNLVTSREFLQLATHNLLVSYNPGSFRKEVQSLCRSEISSDDIVKSNHSGIRAQMVDRKGRMVNDIVVKYLEGSTHVLNAVSPGMTCALEFAHHIVDSMNHPRYVAVAVNQ